MLIEQVRLTRYNAVIRNVNEVLTVDEDYCAHLKKHPPGELSFMGSVRRAGTKYFQVTTK